MSDFRLTAAGRAMIADGENTGTAAVSLTRLALGSGSAAAGAANDGKTALITQRDAVAVVGAVDAAGQVAYRADFRPAASYSITEAGLFGRVGAGGVEKMIAYWTDGGTVLAAAISGAALTVSGVLAVQSAAADVTVTVSTAITLGDPAQAAAVSANTTGRAANRRLIDALRTDLTALQAEALTAATVGRHIDVNDVMAVKWLHQSTPTISGVVGAVRGVTASRAAGTVAFAAGTYWIEGDARVYSNTRGEISGVRIAPIAARAQPALESAISGRREANQAYAYRGVVEVVGAGSRVCRITKFATDAEVTGTIFIRRAGGA